MKWHKTKIELNKLPLLITNFKESIKHGDPTLETLRCVFLMEDDLIACLTPFDFVDNFNKNTKIKLFYTYQVSETDT